MPFPAFRVRTAFRQFCRHSSTKRDPKSPHAQEMIDTIPGAGSTWVQPLKAPFHAYGRMQSRSPYMTQISTTTLIFFLGDFSAQVLSADKEDGFDYDTGRGLRAITVGSLFAIPNYQWFVFLGKHFNYASHSLSIMVKILVNQFVMTPSFNVYFFGMHSLLSGSTIEQAKERIVDTVPTSWVNAWKVWPLSTAIAFTFIAPVYRVAFSGAVAVCWQTYLSWLNLKAAREEAERHSHDNVGSQS